MRVVALLLLVLVAGCDDEPPRPSLRAEALEVLEHADRFEVIALGDVEIDERGEPVAPPGVEMIDGHPVVARGTATRADGARVAASMRTAIERAEGAMLCYSPHHAVRATRDAVTITISICYSCWQLHETSADGPYVAIDPTPIARVLDPLIQRTTRRRFEPGDHLEGRWVPTP